MLLPLAVAMSGDDFVHGPVEHAAGSGWIVVLWAAAAVYLTGLYVWTFGTVEAKSRHWLSWRLLGAALAVYAFLVLASTALYPTSSSIPRVVASWVTLAGLWAVGGRLLWLQIWDVAERDAHGPLDLEHEDGKKSVMTREYAWIKARQEAVKFPPDSNTRVGLALSGGGIRSATISVGFMQELAESPREQYSVLDHIDYLSSVSGGGWAAGALTVRTTSESVPEGSFECGFGKADRERWKQIVDTLRRCTDYMVPGGIGLTAATLNPIIIMLWGAVLQVLASVMLLFALVMISHHSYSVKDPLYLFLTHLREWPALHDVFSGPCHDGCHCSFDGPLGTLHLAALLPVVAAVFSVGCLLAFTVGALLAKSSFCEGSARLAARGLFWVLTLGIPVLVLRASPLVTLVVLLAISVAIVSFAMRRVTGPRFWAGFSVTLVGLASLLVLVDCSPFVTALTNVWGSAIHRFLGIAVLLTSIAPLTDLGAATVYAAGFVLLGMGMNRNSTSLHHFWMRQIQQAYLLPAKGVDKASITDAPVRDQAQWPIAALRFEDGSAADRCPWAARNRCGPRVGAPLHIVNASINTPGSPDPLLRHRGTARFEYSPYAIGGPATGWAPSEHYERHTTFAEAVAVSAAAINSQGGHLIPRGARVFLTMINCGLGVWTRNPRFAGEHKRRFRRYGHFWTGYQFLEMLGLNSEEDSLVFVADGGHHDNLALTALVERRCKLVICLDAGADPEYECGDLARAVRLLRVDGWNFACACTTVAGVRPAEVDGSWDERIRRASLVTGMFSKTDEESGKTAEVKLVYVKPGLLPGLPLDVQLYAQANVDFPHQSTGDQFFSEAQFEAYRMLGRHLALAVKEALGHDPVWKELERVRSAGPAPATNM